MRRANRTILLVWLISLLGGILLSRFASGVEGWTGHRVLPLDLAARLCWFFVVALTVYLLIVAIRYVLRRLFWRVGRRLALSYILIGLLPFFFFAVLMLVVGYLMAGVLSQTTLKMERSATLARLEQWNVQYALEGGKPAGSLETLQVLDTSEGAEIPGWLREGSFAGLVRHEGVPGFVSARTYGDAPAPRTVVLLQPIDDAWRSSLAERNGMITASALARTESGAGGELNIQMDDESAGLPSDERFEEFFVASFQKGGVIWGDISPPVHSWESGERLEDTRVFTMLSNPWVNLLDFYMGDSKYVRYLGVVIMSVVFSLGLVYLFATLLASWLIFSISRAVNRIDHASKAVERGDFSHRIAMRPTSQIGEVAQSFDRMTESIESLLTKVAEKERLQSEIDIAASIQRNLLPRQGPSFPGIAFAAHFEPTAAIGGDYYDVFNLDRSRLALAIGDVSGHGLSTGLVMAMVKAAITTLVEEGADERSMFVRLNELVRRSTDKRTFMTLGFTIFDMERGTLRHTNAGHLYPYLLREGSALQQIEAPALPLGVRDQITPGTVELPLEDGDTLVYLSDGIVEGQNGEGEPFGFERLEAILEARSDAAPEVIRDAILLALEGFCAGKSADDDRTIMIVSFQQQRHRARVLEAQVAEESASRAERADQPAGTEARREEEPGDETGVR